MTQQFDITVIGGGMVGSALALGMAKQGKSVALVETTAPEAFSAEQAMDNRVSAISHASVKLLQELGAWGDIEAMRTCLFRRLETWENEDARIRFNAEDLRIDALGFIVENRLIQLGLWHQFAAEATLQSFCPDRLSNIEFGDESNLVTLESGQQISTELVVAADGANSQVRKLAGIGLHSWDYDHHCMLINVETRKPQQDITWQWFTPSGPRSFLPLPGNQGSLVWYDSPLRIRELMQLSDSDLTGEVIRHFPEELGGIKILQRASFPLTRRHAKQYARNRCVLVGDAAHTINPLAGQGVNLGFKDVKALLHVMSREGKSLDETLKIYQRKRRSDNQLMQTGMDLFYFGFSNELAGVKMLRNTALKLAERSGKLKHQVLKYAIGL